MWWLLLLIPAVLIVFLCVIFIRASRFKPQPQAKAPSVPVEVDGPRAAESLRRMVRCKTVSSYDKAEIDEAEFEKFRALLAELYPNIHRTCTLDHIGDNGLLYRWKGRSDARPTVLMSHYDVVPANAQSWSKPPFEGIIEDGVLWGRGTLDTKSTLCAVMEAVESQIEKGFVPENDLYMAFAGDEEVNGATAPAIVEELRRRGVTPALVVDEGGAVVENVFPGVERPCALVGIAEKGVMNLTLSAESTGGHASTPPPHTLLGKLAKAVVAMEANPFPGRLTKPAAEMFDTLGRHSTLLYRVIFANMWCFKGVLDRICRRTGGELNALMRTTVAVTQAQGSAAPNVLPPTASIGANLRLIGGDTPESALEYLRGVIGDEDVKLTDTFSNPPSAVSETGDASWAVLRGAIEQTWPEAIVSPYLMVACSDSRHYCRISSHVYRFSAMALSAADRALIHANDERISLDKLTQCIQFYVRLISQC